MNTRCTRPQTRRADRQGQVQVTPSEESDSQFSANQHQVFVQRFLTDLGTVLPQEVVAVEAPSEKKSPSPKRTPRHLDHQQQTQALKAKFESRDFAPQSRMKAYKCVQTTKFKGNIFQGELATSTKAELRSVSAFKPHSQHRKFHSCRLPNIGFFY